MKQQVKSWITSPFKAGFASVILFLSAGVLETNAQTHTPLSLPSLFSDHMVLQQEDSVPIWGWGNASSTVKIVGSWAPNDTLSLVVDGQGCWKGKIKTTRYGGPYTLELCADNKDTDRILLKDIMLGEVWMCGGQSNMEWSPQNGIRNQEAEVGAANYPNIRFFSVPKRGSQTRQTDCQAKWETCTPTIMQKRSAVAYFFGRQLHQHLNVPIGLIVSAWGGTSAEVWMPEERVPNTAEQQQIISNREAPWWPIHPGSLYNSMIYPLFPYRIAGVIWYQGESNQDNAKCYASLMENLINSWRKGFEKEIPFYQVQIAPYNYNTKDNGSALIREAQEQVTRIVPRTAFVVTNDIGDYNNIHPAQKQEVGIRLGNIALKENYHVLNKEVFNPSLKEATLEKSRVTLTFSHAEEGLVCKEKAIKGFQIAGEDGIFKEAKGIIKGSSIQLYAPGIKRPTAVQYCYDMTTVGNVFNQEGLPVAPFHRQLHP